MAIPSGSGTEVLKFNHYQAVASETLIFQGVANHIYTILSLIVTNTDGSNNRELYLKLYDASGTSNEHQIIQGSVIPASGTYVFNDKFVISGAYNLRVTTASGDSDVILSYIDQDWT